MTWIDWAFIIMVLAALIAFVLFKHVEDRRSARARAELAAAVRREFTCHASTVRGGRHTICGARLPWPGQPCPAGHLHTDNPPGSDAA
ncbi:hypothetical protein [Amycolatopsis thermophila]|uniref:Uncharacterized protein n=1 Tax=Amycolatopsis thermophila TaxID=206084 RepID=A0ABU0EMQ5_9PSEU|nr:hypothetical protein [Amycolatopsis thermophila]MDQ0376556.1 hypothetical protein [Amycolatopsis thermophila]